MKIKKETINDTITFAIIFIAFGVVEVMLMTGSASRHMQSMLVPICINIILAVSLNLVIGFLGELSLGHAGFMSVGAYAGCLFSIWAQDIIPTFVRFPLAMLVGGFFAGVAGLIIGIPVLRLNGDYLAIVTLAFGEIIRSIVINLGFTGGASGLKNTPQDAGFISSVVVVVITVMFVMNLTNSKHGRAIMSLRDNKIAAEACGISINYYKLLAFIAAAFFAGVAGVIYGHNFSILSAGDFDYNKSIEILVIVVLGGMGNIRGGVIAATIITVLPEALRFLNDYRMLIYAVVLIAIMLLNTNEKFITFKNQYTFNNIYKAVKIKLEMRKERK
ncbi:MAG: branched-chain amino acid ABC transporter permease [Oscillospiraceae bacterium]